jgi:hypothetical protein
MTDAGTEVAKVVEIPGGFRVQEANSQALAYVYFHQGSDAAMSA